MNIIGISAYYHDSSAVLVVDGKVIAAAQEERFSRIKHDSSFPSKACRFCLEFANISINEIDAFVFYEKPLLKFERILESMIASAPISLKQFVKVMPIWLKDKLNMRSLIKKELKKEFGQCKPIIKFVEHHLSHAAFAFYTSGFKSSSILVMDAVGEWATTSLFKASDNTITLLKEQHYPNSVGLLYSSFTYFLGFQVNSDEYKVMGLAPYGFRNSSETEQFIRLIKDEIVSINDDGSIKLNLNYFEFQYGFKMIKSNKWERLFGISKRIPGSKISQSHCNLALAIQTVTEEIAERMTKELSRLTKDKNLCISGGTALNCSMNGKLKQMNLFDNIYIPCSPGDGGGSIGAALAYSYLNTSPQNKERNQSPYLGPLYKNDDIKDLLVFNSLEYTFIDDENELCSTIANYLSQGKIIGWFQGRMEFGPRALGNRSIIADCRYPDMKDRINASIKFREGFRPFAPTVLEDHKQELFNMDFESPYMMFTTSISSQIRKEYARGNDFTNDINSELSSIPAVTHIDYSARVQTLREEDNPLFYKLISTYYRNTGCPAILNTSFNVMGEPIVCSPKDAIDTFNKSGIEILVLGNYILKK